MTRVVAGELGYDYVLYRYERLCKCTHETSPFAMLVISVYIGYRCEISCLHVRRLPVLGHYYQRQ